MTSNITDITNAFVEHFKNILARKVDRQPLDIETMLSGPQLTVNAWSSLTAPVVTEEIILALFDIENEKSPGADGFGSCFFKSSWPIVGNDVTEAVQKFFINGKLLKQWNHTVIALIPKTTEATTVNDYRSISCCTVFYKLIAEVLASRLKKTLVGLVDNAQAAFVEGRSILDNIHLAQELLRKHSRKYSSPRCTLKVDLQKAFDTIDWEFLREVLSLLNFPTIFTDWIMECVSTTSFSIALNGNLYGHFNGRRGLRQGDLLSPFLFALCMEPLSRKLNCLSASNNFGFHPKCRNLRITHLAYADDLLLFSKGDVGSISMIMGCMKTFGDMAGLHVNLQKLNVYFSSVEERVKEEILNITEFECGSIPFRYLGIPLSSKKPNTCDYSRLVDAIRTKISAWPRHTLSYAGKLELIRSVIQGIECYWLSILPLSSNIIDLIYALCRKFIRQNKHPPIAWRSMCNQRQMEEWV